MPRLLPGVDAYFYMKVCPTRFWRALGFGVMALARFVAFYDGSICGMVGCCRKLFSLSGGATDPELAAIDNVDVKNETETSPSDLKSTELPPQKSRILGRP